MRFIPPPLQAILWALIAWILSQRFPELAFETQAAWLFIGGFVGLGIVIDLLALIQVSKARTGINPINLAGTKVLVTDGVYKISRNPMYLGMLCYLIGLTYALANPLAVIAPVGFVLLMNATQIKREEQWLAEQFGAPYEQYRQNVKRWFGARNINA